MQTPLHAIEAMLPRLSLQEKAQLLEQIVFELSGYQGEPERLIRAATTVALYWPRQDQNP